MTKTEYTTCPDCFGKGHITAERAVVDYERGGHLKECRVECDACNGRGEIEVDDDDDHIKDS